MIMGLCGSILIAALLVFLPCFCVNFGAAINTISSSQFIKDPEAIVSPGNTFKLGFFNPVNTTNRYVGIWYNKLPVTTPIWVANRNKPLTDSCGIMTVSEDGNLVVLNGKNEVLWSSNVSNGVQNSSAHLTEDGNIVLQDAANGKTIWESFQQPSNTYVKNMRLTNNERTGEKILLTSWKSPFDPSMGSFSSGIANSENLPQTFIWNGSRIYWRSGPWNGRVFMGIPRTAPNYLGGLALSEDSNGIISLSYNYSNESLLLHQVLSSKGQLSENIWSNKTNSWGSDWKVPETECDVYNKCGAFGVCNSQNSPICNCLRGFEPKNADEWIRGNWTGGCVRRKLLQCERIENGGEEGKEDGFWKLEGMKVPDLVQWSPSFQQECMENCLNNCSCVAYTYVTDLGCMKWTRNLIDLQKLSIGGTDLYIRLSYSELDNNGNMRVIVGVTVPTGAIVLLICAFSTWRWAEWKKKKKDNLPSISEVNKLIDNMNPAKLQELPVFSLQKLAAATDNFNITNKLGQGGFGPVYWGKFSDGQEIAVKRLSRASGQGLEEFVNEVVVISKLQHRNLVRLLGCSIEGEDKMLVYEYMSNKSLDAFLFGPHNKELLDWRKRFHIVEGICRGLLYLHRDSRLRIIHRDLKASNILLDQELNPKISDFGMARIFGGNEDQVYTRRVVGTYGYMSPEYAMQGRFSEKSDVFSFGVLLLEIVSGRRNTNFHEDDQDLCLLGFAWKLWNERKTAALVDPVLSDPCYQVVIFRCIQVGLLCVQEFARDRPTISTVLSMLNSEIVDLPTPKQPAFSERKISLDSDTSHKGHSKCSVNTMTFSVVDGR